MTDIYSPALAIALAASVLALIVAVDMRLAIVPFRPDWRRHLSRLARISAWLSLVALLVSVVSHVWLGHTPGSDAALDGPAFLAEHPMMLFVAGMGLIALWLGHRYR